MRFERHPSTPSPLTIVSPVDDYSNLDVLMWKEMKLTAHIFSPWLSFQYCDISFFN